MIFRKITSLALIVAMIAVMLVACKPAVNNKKPNGSSSNNNPTTSQNGKATYRVTIIDVNGKPATSGVVVKFMKNGEQEAMEIVNTSGVAAKELDKGDYTVELLFTNQDIQYHYDQTDMTLSKTKTELTINLYMMQSDAAVSLYDGEYTAYPISTGNTYVTLKPGRNYFLYNPVESGEYELFTTNGAYRVGNYGSAHFIRDYDPGYVEEINGSAISVSSNMIDPENSIVVGVDNPTNEDVQTVLHIVRKSEYIDTSVPKRDYLTKHSLQAWKLPAGAQISQFDISASTAYQFVLDDQGFYHLNTVDGPLVVVFLGKEAESYMPYLASYDTILKNTRVAAYFKNEDGTWDHCEDYSTCLQEYIGVFNETNNTYTGGCIDHDSGLYPLTEDLKYIIQQHGAFSGWWDADGESYIFDGTVVNEENAWLFMCGYLTIPSENTNL